MPPAAPVTTATLPRSWPLNQYPLLPLRTAAVIGLCGQLFGILPARNNGIARRLIFRLASREGVHCCIVVHAEELHDRIAMFMRQVHDPMGTRQEFVVRPPLHQIADIDDESALDGRNLDPLTCRSLDLKPGLLRLPDGREYFVVPVGSDTDLPHIPIRRLRRIVASAQT